MVSISVDAEFEYHHSVTRAESEESYSLDLKKNGEIFCYTKSKSIQQDDGFVWNKLRMILMSSEFLQWIMTVCCF